ncbi:MAG: arginase family protein [Bacteriovoracaceae bacterium]|nr:arginase family protein [Bacteriovoracaceae bacterium]
MSNLTTRAGHYLCTPGNGVYTVHTAKELKDEYHQKLYNTVDPKQVKNAWKESLNKLSSSSSPALLGITSDIGGGIQRGANWGPLFIRNVLDVDTKSIVDLGDTKTIPHFLHDKYLNKETIKKCQKELYGSLDLPVSALSIAEDFAYRFHSEYPERALISLGGDHSVSYPLVKSWLKAKNEQNKRVAIIHFDAHTDLMDQRLGVDISFASWAYHMIEQLDTPSDLLQYGIRSSGKPKEFWTEKLGIQQYWAQDFKEMGIGQIIDETLTYLRKRKIEEVYISFDIDFLDASYASSTGTPEKADLLHMKVSL